jgi:hypothetical protein
MESFGVVSEVDGLAVIIKITIHATGTLSEEGATCSGLSQVPEYPRKMKGVLLIFNEDELCGQ